MGKKDHTTCSKTWLILEHLTSRVANQGRAWVRTKMQAALHLLTQCPRHHPRLRKASSNWFTPEELPFSHWSSRGSDFFWLVSPEDMLFLTSLPRRGAFFLIGPPKGDIFFLICRALDTCCAKETYIEVPWDQGDQSLEKRVFRHIRFIKEDRFRGNSEFWI